MLRTRKFTCFASAAHTVLRLIRYETHGELVALVSHTEGRVWSSCNDALVLRSQHVDRCSITTVFDGFFSLFLLKVYAVCKVYTIA